MDKETLDFIEKALIQIEMLKGKIDTLYEQFMEIHLANLDK